MSGVVMLAKSDSYSIQGKSSENLKKLVEDDPKKIERVREKIEKDIEKLDKDHEKKDKEREKTVQREIEKMEKDRGKNEKKEEMIEREGKSSARDGHVFAKEKHQAQRTRLHELFGQIEKEFEILWDENQELRKKLEDAMTWEKGGSGNFSNTLNLKNIPDRKTSSKDLRDLRSRINPLKKKEHAPEWDRLTHFIGHRDGIWEVSTCRWEKHSNSFATASADRTARIWSSDASTPVYIYINHKGSVNSARFHPTNRLVCTASGDNSCHVWRFPKPEEKKDKLKEEKVEPVKPWAPLLETKDPKPVVVVEKPSESPRGQSPPSLDVQTGIIPPPLPPTERELPDASMSAFGVVTLTRSVVEMYHKNVVIAADWLSSGDTLVSGSWDNTLKEWNLETGKCILDLQSGHEAPHYFTNVTTHSSLPLVLTSSSDFNFRIWDLRASTQLVHNIRGHGESVSSACFTNDENVIVSGSDDRTIKVWDKRNLKTPKITVRCSSGVNRFSVSPLSSHIAIPQDDVRTKVCDMNGRQLGRLKSEVRNGHKLMLSSTAWSNDESVVFTTGFDRSVIAWAKPSPSPVKKQ